MNKYLELKEKTSFLLKNILKNEDNYMNFLKFYGKIYKYDFFNALLLYSQNTSANAFATYNEWKQVGYQVRKGEKGIALFENNNQVKYVFGVDSTYQQKINLWKYNEESHKELINLDKTIDYDDIEENLKDFAYCSNMLAKLTRLNIVLNERAETKIKQNLKKGLEYIRNNKIEDIEELLNSICKYIENDLREIEQKVKFYEKERKNNYGNENNRWNEVFQGGTRLLVSSNRDGRVESRQMGKNGNEIYGENQTRQISNDNANEQVSTDIQRSRPKSLGDVGEIIQGEIGERADTRRLEYTRTNSTQEDVAKRSGRGNNQGINTDRPLSRDKYKQGIGTIRGLENEQEKEQENVPFF